MKKKSVIIVLVIGLLLNTLVIIAHTFQPLLSTKPVPEGRSTGYDTTSFPSSDVYQPTKISLAGEEVPLKRQDVVEAFQRELIVNTYLHSSTIQLLKNAPRYFEQIEPILRREGVPDDFKYLAVIESNLNPLALSPAGAAGIWQFMVGTAKEYGLEVNDEVDERYNLEKSTVAACAYLKTAYEKFGSWTVAAAAYNCGMSQVSKQIEMQLEDNYYNLVLPIETNRYIFRFLALKQILENPQVYHFHVSESWPLEKYRTVKVSESIPNLAEFAQKKGISYKTLKRFNPWLRKNTLKVGNGKSYEIAIPLKKEDYR